MRKYVISRSFFISLFIGYTHFRIKQLINVKTNIPFRNFVFSPVSLSKESFMNGQQTNIEQRLIEYYEGKLEGETCNEIKEWIASSEDNRTTARRIYSLLLATDIHQVRKEIDIEQALQKVKDRKIVQKGTVSWWKWGQRAAAILFLPLVGLLLWQQSLIQHTEHMAEMLEIRTNPGVITRFQLPDGTSVCLNSESTLRYPSKFTEDTRSVQLVGEAYFEVTTNRKQRFIVYTPDKSAVEVYGTHFNLEAYPDNPEITTTLTEGKVGFLYKEEGITKRAMLAPGQKLIYNTSTQHLSHHLTSGLSELSWTEGKIIFDNTPLSEALHMLGKLFNVDFIVKDSNLNENRFTGTFTTQRLEKILKYFEISSHIHWRYLNDPDINQEKMRIEIY